MSYPGNPALPQETQTRAIQTFQQSVQLATAGREQEAMQGCQFILQLDPLFRPAQQLLERLQSGLRPITTNDLLAAVSAAAPASPAPASAGSGLGAVLQDLLNKGNHQQVLQIAATQRDAIAADPQLQQMVASAQAGAERAAFVKQSLDAARAAFAAGQFDQAQQHLAKAREIDPQNTDVATLAQQIAATQAASAAAPATPQAAGTPINLGGDDDFLALQQQSLALDSDGLDLASIPDVPAAPQPAAPQQAALSADAAGAFGLDDAAPSIDMPSLDLNDVPSLDLDAPLEMPADDPPSLDLDDVPSLDLEDAASLDLDDVPSLDLEASLDDAPSLDLDDMPSLDLDDAASLDLDDVPSLDFAAEPAAAPAIPAPAAPAPAAPAPAAAPAEGGDRISQLLAEGQKLFDIDEFQAAIDVWSRIFLIDIDNGEASNRIEEARNRKAELERQAEQKFHEGIDQIEAESLEEAKASFRQVLELQPNHSLAKEYLEQLEAGQVPTVIKRSQAEEPDIDLDNSLDSDFSDMDEGEPGSPSMDAAVQRDRMVVVKKTDKKLVALGALVLIAVIGGTGFLVTKWDELFPNTEQQPPPPVERPDPIARATGMYEDGNIELAIQNLESIPVGDARYEDALALLEQWRAEIAGKAEPAGPSPELVARRDLLLSAARDAYGNGYYIRAQRYFDRADKILPLDPPDRDKSRDAEEKLEPLGEAISLFEEAKYVEIIPDLWRKLDDNPLDHDAKLLLVNSYFNLSLTDLQRGDARSAAEKLTDALDAAPRDEDLQRLKLFAESYSQQEQDLLYKIYVKYAPTR